MPIGEADSRDAGAMLVEATGKSMKEDVAERGGVGVDCRSA